MSVKETSLDPEDWGLLKALLHEALDEAIKFQSDIKTQPAWSSAPTSSKAVLHQELPEKPGDIKKLKNVLTNHVLPYPLGNIHPRHWSWVNGTGVPENLLTAIYESAMNCNVFGANQMPIYIEQQVAAWLKKIMNFPESSGCAFTTGTSMGNLMGLQIALNEKAPANFRKYGLQHPENKGLRVYTSEQAHNSIPKAVRLTGLGEEALVSIPTDNTYGLSIEALEKAIQKDKAKGLIPIAVMATVGTVNSGGIDPIENIHTLCQQENIWLHVDGAFGAAAILTQTHKDKIKALSKADSLAFDLHKWFYQGYSTGCLLVRDPDTQKSTYSAPATYLQKLNGGIANGPINNSDYSFELSRGNRGLAFWVSLQLHGTSGFARQIQQNIDQAEYLTSLVKKHSELELLAPTTLNIVNFRYIGHHQERSAKSLNTLNQEILITLHEKGIAVPGYTLLNDKFSIRVAITNHRSKCRDFDALVENILEIGNKIQTT